MKPAPFEQFIKSLLDQAAASDALRDLTKRNIPIENSSLMSAVDAILLKNLFQLNSTQLGMKIMKRN